MQTARKKGPTPEPPPDGWLSMLQAAEALNVTRYTLLQLMADGHLVHQTVGGRRYVSWESIETRRAAAAPNE